MKGRRILIAEDDKAIASSLRILLEQQGGTVQVAHSLKDAEACLEAFKPELLVLDVGLPDGNGMDFCARLKASSGTRALPVFMLTAHGSAQDIVRGLECGAEDYLPKPFHEMELLARISVILRRQKPAQAKPKALVLGGLKLDPASHQAWAGKKPLNLTLREFEILEVLMTNPGQALTRLEIIRQAWGENHATVERAVDVHLGHLREKLGNHADRITTVPRLGYRFESNS